MSEAASPVVSLFVPSMGGVGGVERIVVNLSKGLVERGYEVEVASCDFDGPLVAELPPEASRSRLPRVDVPAAPVLGTIPGLVAYLRRRRPHTLISFMNQVNVVALLSRRLARVETRLIISDHNNPRLLIDERNPVYRKDRLIYRAAKYIYPWADGIVAVSEGVAEDLADVADIDRSRITTIYNPVVSDSLREQMTEPCDHEWINDDETRVLLGAKPEAQKNLSLLVRALSRIEDEDVRLVIVGTGEQSDLLETLSRDLGIEDRVDVRGYVENIYAYMSRADVFALSSHWEGLPTILIEALACGCPVVSTDCPSGPREILNDGEFGRLVPVDDEAALAGAIRSVLESPPDRERLYRRAEDFGVRTATDQYERLIGA